MPFEFSEPAPVIRLFYPGLLFGLHDSEPIYGFGATGLRHRLSTETQYFATPVTYPPYPHRLPPAA